jgi:hypothetical protein
MKRCIPLLTLALAGCVIHANRPRSAGPEGPPLAKTDLERLSAAGISDPVVLELIERRGAVKLSSDDVVSLKNAGASDAVIQKALASVRPEVVVVKSAAPARFYPYYYPYYWGYATYYAVPSVSFGYYQSWGHHGGMGFSFGW